MEKISNIKNEYSIDQKRIDSLLNEILSDKELMTLLKNLGLKEEEIPLYLPILAMYQDNKKEIENDPEAFQMVLEISDSGKLSFHYEETEKQKEARHLVENYYIRDFSDEWLSSSLKSFRTDREKELKKEIVSSLKDKFKNWFYIYGDLGTGKSYALAAFCNDLARKGRKVCFMSATKRFDELKSLAIKNKDVFDKTMKTLYDLDFLVIDDFGNEYKSDYVRDQVILPLLSERTKNHKVTMFSSDYSLDEIEELYSQKYGTKIIAKKLVNIIKGNLRNSKAEYKLQKGLENVFNQR